MNLISCDNCAVVLDRKNLYFPHDIYKDDGSIDMGKAEWDGEDYVPYLNCPICEGIIFAEKEEG